jgi:hypothetical protein
MKRREVLRGLLAPAAARAMESPEALQREIKVLAEARDPLERRPRHAESRRAAHRLRVGHTPHQPDLVVADFAELAATLA